MTAETCTNCDGLLVTSGLRAELGIDWQCAWCGQAGTNFAEVVNGRTVRGRLVTVKGAAPPPDRRWVLAESMPYAQRVATGRAAQ